MCHTTLLSTPTSSQTCAVRSSGSRRRLQIRRVASSTQTGLTSAMSRVKSSPHCLLQYLNNILIPNIHYSSLLSSCHLSPLVAEVQAHSSHQSRAEMDQLREHLLDAFRQQMEIRRSLMELENSNMENQIDTSKHLLTIAESVFRIYISVFPTLSDSVIQ